MATILRKLKDEGWFISEEGLKKINDNGLVSDVKGLIKRALDHDLRELVTAGGLPNDMVKTNKAELPQTGVVVQIVNVKNVSAPKSNQESKSSPRLLQLDFTDGSTLCSGLDLDSIPGVNINTAPGTKIYLKNPIKMNQGFLVLNTQNVNVLGGQVQALYEKWESTRTLAKYGGGQHTARGKSATENLKGTPPPWIPFGTKIQSSVENDAAFKSLNETKAKEISKEESEFQASRNNAIAEASTKGELRKQFGGSNRQMMDHNVKKILDKGYTEEQARLALKIARNNLERAMSQLKKRAVQNDTDRKPRTTSDSATGYSKRGGKFNSIEPPPAKPSGKVSLFDFLSDKIPEVVEAPALVPPKPTTTRNNSSGEFASSSKTRNVGQYQSNHTVNDNSRSSKFENNISSTFASRQKKDDFHGRSKWGGDDGARGEKHSSSKPNASSNAAHPSSASSSYKSSQQNSHSNQNSNSNANSNSNSNYQNNKNTRYNSNMSNDTHHYNDTNTKRAQNDRNDIQANSKPKASMKDVIEATANLTIDKQPKQSLKQQKQKPQQQQQQPPQKVVVQPQGQQAQQSQRPQRQQQSNQNNYPPQQKQQQSQLKQKPQQNQQPQRQQQQQSQHQQPEPQQQQKQQPPLPPQQQQYHQAQQPRKQSQPILPTPPQPSHQAQQQQPLQHPHHQPHQSQLQHQQHPQHAQHPHHPQNPQHAQHPQHPQHQQIQYQQHPPNPQHPAHQHHQQHHPPQHHQSQPHPPPSQTPQQQQQRTAAFEEMFPQAKGFPYNPYKIMGFQNKETNEFAMKVLNRVGESPAPPPPVNMVPNNPPNVKLVPQPQQMPIVPVQATMPPQQQAPKPFIAYNINVPPQQAPPQSFIWNFKVGERCLAKYWEDEKYYNAEIQAVTDKTCVVHFLEYGNTEEVLLTDCLPITDHAMPAFNHFHPNHFAQGPPQPHPGVIHQAMPAPPQPQPQQMHPPRNAHRGSRQVYVKK